MPADALANCKVSVSFSAGPVNKNVPNSLAAVLDTSLSLNDTAIFTLGNNLILGCDNIISLLNPPSGTKIATSGTLNLDLSGSLSDILGTASVVNARLKAIMVELLTNDAAKQNISTYDATNGTTCSSVTLGAAGANPWPGPMGTTGTYTINNGGIWLHVDPTAAGIPITAGTGDILKILNNDSGQQASLRVTIFAGSA